MFSHIEPCRQHTSHLVFKASHGPIPPDKNEDTAWREVELIEIVFIGDYND